MLNIYPLSGSDNARPQVATYMRGHGDRWLLGLWKCTRTTAPSARATPPVSALHRSGAVAYSQTVVWSAVDYLGTPHLCA